MTDVYGQGSTPDQCEVRDRASIPAANTLDECLGSSGVGRARIHGRGNRITEDRRTAHMALLCVVGLVVAVAFGACGGTADGRPRPTSTSATGGNLTVAYILTGGELTAYDAATGQKLWRFMPAQPASMPSLMARDGVLYLSAGDLYALRATDGRPLWETPIGGAALGSPPQFARGALYVASDGVVSAVNARDGTLLWHAQVGSGLDTLLMDADAGILYDGVNGLTALRAGDGSQLWQVSTHGSGLYSLQLAGGALYASTTDNRLLALDPADGHLRWSYQNPTLQTLSRPTISGSMIYLSAQTTVASNSATGAIGVRTLETVVAVRAKDGATLWQRRMNVGMSPPVGVGIPDPVVSGDATTVYIVAGPTDGDVVALAAADGAIRWQRPSNDTITALLGGDGGTLYTGGMSGDVVAPSSSDGTPRWQTSLGHASPVMRLSLEQGTLYAATADVACAALDPKTGRVRWLAAAGSAGSVGAAPLPATIVVMDIPR